MILVNVITKCGPLVAYDEFMFPINEGLVQDKKCRKRLGINCFLLRDKSMAENMWQAKPSRANNNAATKEDMFIGWLEHLLTPAFRTCFWDGKKWF